MRTIAEGLADPIVRKAVVADAARFLEAEVAGKRGVRGAALKAGFRTFQAIQPGMVERAIDGLLPHFAPVLDPLWIQARTQPDPTRWLIARDQQMADAMLGVTDGLAARTQNRVLARIYRGLRGQARGHVVEGIPGLVGVLMKHAGDPIE